jgi:hypothetical protein
MSTRSYLSKEARASLGKEHDRSCSTSNAKHTSTGVEVDLKAVARLEKRTRIERNRLEDLLTMQINWAQDQAARQRHGIGDMHASNVVALERLQAADAQRERFFRAKTKVTSLSTSIPARQLKHTPNGTRGNARQGKADARLAVVEKQVGSYVYVRYLDDPDVHNMAA